MSHNEMLHPIPQEDERSLVLISGILPRRFPEFALLDTKPFPEPINTRQKVYNGIYSSLQSHPFRWINTTTLAKDIGSTRQRTEQLLSAIPDINLFRQIPTQIDQEHLI